MEEDIFFLPTHTLLIQIYLVSFHVQSLYDWLHDFLMISMKLWTPFQRLEYTQSNYSFLWSLDIVLINEY